MELETALDMLMRCSPVPTERVATHKCVGRVASQYVTAKTQLPHTDLAIMDGYAVCTDTHGHGGEYKINEIKSFPNSKTEGVKKSAAAVASATYVTTGAPIPPMHDCVVPIENCTVKDTSVYIPAQEIEKGRYIRYRGEEVREDTIIIRRGMRIDAATIGICALCKIPELNVFKHPRVALASTGDEICNGFSSPTNSGVGDANGPMLMSLMHMDGCHNDTGFAILKDDCESIKTWMKTQLDKKTQQWA